MVKHRLITSAYAVLSTAVCMSIILFLNSTSHPTMASAGREAALPMAAVEEQALTPVQQAVLYHIQKIEESGYRRTLIIDKIEKTLEEQYRLENLMFADEAFVPKAGRAYQPKDIVVTDSAVILTKYAIIPEDTDGNRLTVLNTGACLIDSVPYFWGGKASNKGWNKRWGQDVIVSAGSFIAQVATESQEELRYADKEQTQVLVPYGLDCSGFVDWAYWTGLGYRIGGNTRQQWANCNPITEEELLPGDLGFLCSPSDAMVNHVGMYIGTNKKGDKMWLHCSSDKGVKISSPKFAYYMRPNIDIYYEEN